MAHHGVLGSADEQRLGERFARLEQEAIFGRYGRFYAAMAVVMLALSFMPLLQDVVTEDHVTEYGSLWEISARPGGGPAAAGLLLMLALLLFLTVATFRPTWTWPLVGAVGDGALVTLMLLTRPGTGDPTPDLAPAGQAGLALVLLAMALCVGHAVHLYRHAHR
jgi:hypothetical protein